MKHLLGLLLALSFGLFLPNPAVAAEWLLVAETPDGSRAYFDRESLRREGPYAWFWLSMTLSNFRQSGYAIETVMVYLSADCNTKQTRLRQLMFYDKDKKLIYSQAPGDEGPTEFISSSREVLHDALEYACGS